jgi:hypothetical protein
MTADATHRWQKIAANASREEDPAKLLELCRELSDAIDQESDEQKKAKLSHTLTRADELSKDQLPKTGT